jgi:hypothetical protein
LQGALANHVSAFWDPSLRQSRDTLVIICNRHTQWTMSLCEVSAHVLEKCVYKRCGNCQAVCAMSVVCFWLNHSILRSHEVQCEKVRIKVCCAFCLTV